jgi:CRP/FNR family cyclic AMP-dependent transcriptional regulator
MSGTRETPKNQIIKLLSNIQLFSSLSSKELQQILGKIEIRRPRKGEMILRQEDVNQYMYVILEGKVKVIQITQDGKETMLAIHRSGESFGELSLIDNKTAPAMVLAAEGSTIAIISRKDFYSLLYTQGKVLETLLQILCSRLRDSWGRIELLSLRNASQRLRMLLLRLSHEHGRPDAEGTILTVRLTHQDIANMVGTARETVTRTMDKWQKDGDIKFLKGRYILLRHDFYQKVTGGVPAEDRTKMKRE